MFDKKLKEEVEQLKDKVSTLEQYVQELLRDKQEKEDLLNPLVMGGRK